MANGLVETQNPFAYRTPAGIVLRGTTRFIVEDEGGSPWNPVMDALVDFTIHSSAFQRSLAGTHPTATTFDFSRYPVAERGDIPGSDFVLQQSDGSKLHLDGATLLDEIDDHARTVASALIAALAGSKGAYSATRTYALGDLVQAGSAVYWSLSNGNVGNAVSDTSHWAHLTGSTATTGLTRTQVLALFATWARATPTGTPPWDGRLLPVASAQNNGMIAKIVNGAWALAADNAGTSQSGLNAVQVAALMYPWALRANTSLTADQQAQARVLIGAPTFEGEWGTTSTEGPVTTPTRGGILHDTGIDMPADATEMRWSYDGDFRTDQYVGMLDLSRVRDLPNLGQDRQAGLAADKVITVSVTGPPPPGSVENYWARQGDRLWFGTAEGRGDNEDYTIRVQFRRGRLERFADADHPTAQIQLARVPRLTDAQMPQDVLDRLNAAEQNVQSDWDVADTASDAFIRNKPTIVDATTVPDSDVNDGNDVLVVQRSGRKDAELRLADVSGSLFWGGGRGSTVAIPMDAGTRWGAVVKGIRWRPGTRLLTVWIDDASGEWDRLYVGGISYSPTVAANSVVPWVTGSPSYRTLNVTLSADAAMYFDDAATAVKQFNLRDLQGDAGSDYVVGNPFVREAKLGIEEVRDDIPAVRSLPPKAQRATGDQWRLLVDLGAVPQVGELTWDGSAFPAAEVPGVYSIYAPASGTFQGRVSVDRGSDTRTPTSIEIGDTSYPLTAGGAQFRHLFVTAAGAVTLTSGTLYAVNVVFSDGTKLWADINVRQGDLVAWDGLQLVVTEDVHTTEDVEAVLTENQQRLGQFVRSATMLEVVILTETAFEALETAGTVDANTLYLRT